MGSGKFSGKEFAKEELVNLLPKINNIFKLGSAVLKIDNEPVMLIGDIHGDLPALKFIMDKRKEINQKTKIHTR